MEFLWLQINITKFGINMSHLTLTRGLRVNLFSPQSAIKFHYFKLFLLAGFLYFFSGNSFRNVKKSTQCDLINYDNQKSRTPFLSDALVIISTLLVVRSLSLDIVARRTAYPGCEMWGHHGHITLCDVIAMWHHCGLWRCSVRRKRLSIGRANVFSVYVKELRGSNQSN